MKSCVLIVDDQAIIRKTLHALFEAYDIDVCEAENGAEGVQKAQALNPGLVILDLCMPVMNGLEAAWALQLTMPHVRLLMLTNNNGAAMEKEARSAGIFAVISKSDSDAAGQLIAHAKMLLGLDGIFSSFHEEPTRRRKCLGYGDDSGGAGGDEAATWQRVRHKAGLNQAAPFIGC